jgi:D-serine deaminase-like pyridoxal phosphate-dependent protein
VQITDLQTPCVLVERSRVARNIDRMQAAADAKGIRLRPHAKTHKSPQLAAQQIARGAVGITCAKLGEAEVFADAGIDDIRLAYPLNPVNAPRVAALTDRVRLSFIVDHAEVARAWSEAMRRAGREVDVLVKVDVGFHRCGIDPGAAGAADFVLGVAKLPGLRFKGLLSHAGQAYGAGSDEEIGAIADEEQRILTGLATAVAARGVAVAEISVGSTPTARFNVERGGITELRPGNYVYFDRTQVGLGAAAWSDCALTVLARVVSTPAADRMILDCGSKTLTNDLARGFAPQPGYGAVMESLEALAPNDSVAIERLSEEHANVRRSGGRTFAPGDLVRVVPNHSCVVSNLVDSAWLVDGADVLGKLEVAARGRIQ